MGFTSRGCVRECGFCFVPKKEGKFRDVAEIKDLINPKSNVLILHDNNLTADPLVIDKLHKYIKPYRHMCFMLVGFNTTFEEDFYRFKKLRDFKVDPYVMIYNQKKDLRLKHFARWVNGRIYKSCSWEEYEPWIKAQLSYFQLSFV